MTSPLKPGCEFKRCITANDFMPQERDTNGKLLCVWCRTTILKGRQRKYCSGKCSEEVAIRIFPSVAADRAMKRDNWTCQKCKTTSDSLEVDHIIPVSEGGGACGLDNLRSLCKLCHLEETRALHKRLSRKRRAEARLKKG